MDPSGCCVERITGKEGKLVGGREIEYSRKASKEAMAKAQQKDSCSNDNGNVEALGRSLPK